MRSKRQRKQKDKNSLKRKRGEGTSLAREDLTDVILDEGLAPGERRQDGAVLVLAPKQKSGRQQEGETAPKLNKKEQRKLRRIAEDKELKAQRQEVFESLAQHALPDSHFAFLRSASSIGQKETKRQRVAREFAMQKAGLHLPADAELERRRGEAVADGLPITLHQEHKTAAVDKTGRSADSALDEESIESSVDERSAAQSEIDDEDTGALTPSPAPDPAAVRDAADKARQELGLPPLSASSMREEMPAAVPGTMGMALSGKSRLVEVSRRPEIEAARSQLPIIGMEQEIMEAVLEHDVLVLAGETGCGKTTQVPQFLYEAGFGCSQYLDRAGMVGVTQPRRVAAIASAERVASELNTPLGTTVGYQVRYDRKVGEAAAVKFMTDGILLREVQLDFLLQKYSCLVIDEAHERSLNTDLIIGMLSRIVPMRRKMADEGTGSALKLIIMSATLRTEDFVSNKKLFPQPPPLVTAPARQYPVTVHFSRRTELHDYVGAAFAKVSQIHRHLPPGGILVFVTGQREVEHLSNRLRSISKCKPNTGSVEGGSAEPAAGAEDANIGLESSFGGDAAEAAESADRTDEAGDESTLDDFDDGHLSEEEDTVLLGGEGFSQEELAAAEERLNEQLGWKATPAGTEAAQGAAAGVSPVHVLPLYAMLPRESQARVFEAVPQGHRLIVVATNVAETSLTIPGIRYVVDTGRAKQKLLEMGTGMARFEVGWISKASAEQRAGRAGRTGPGHCYRLFSSAVFNDELEKHSPPEILNTALEGVVLVMKAMSIDKVDKFPFPTPPQLSGLREAQQCLAALGAVEGPSAAITPLGCKMAAFPLSPRHARLLIQIAEDVKSRAKVLPLATALAAAMSVETPFVHIDNIQTQAGESGDAESAQKERQRARAAHAQLRDPSSDALSALVALLGFEAAPNRAAFCSENRLHAKNLAEMSALHRQLQRLVAQKFPEACAAESTMKLTQEAAISLRKAIAAGWPDQVARRVHSEERACREGEGGKKRAVRYRVASAEEDVYLHPQSGLHSRAPQFLVYTQLVRSAKRPYMAGITEVDAHWLVESGTPLCSVSSPLDDPPPQYVAVKDAVLAWHDVAYGRHLWDLPRTRRLHPERLVRARVFAAALLDGQVLTSMGGLKPLLAVPPATACKIEAQGQPRVGRLISALLAHSIDSRSSLKMAWAADASLLKAELAAWMQKGRAAELVAAWPTLQEECREKKAKRRAMKQTRRPSLL